MQVNVQELFNARTALAAKRATLEEGYLADSFDYILNLTEQITIDINICGESILEGERGQLS